MQVRCLSINYSSIILRTPLDELIAPWLSDESGYDAETWPEIAKDLDDDRQAHGARLLFPQDNEKSVYPRTNTCR